MKKQPSRLPTILIEIALIVAMNAAFNWWAQ